MKLHPGSLIACCVLVGTALLGDDTAASRIKVGLIRADSHGIYYAALMDDIDPLLLLKPPTTQTRPPYSWMRGRYHRLFYSQSNPTQRTAPFVGGCDIVKVWDESEDAARTFAQVLRGEPRVCASFEEVSDGVDLVLVADCNYDGSDHLKLAAPGLKKGVPTFVDKPFAFDLKDARAMVDLARASGAPLYSRSILSELPQVERFRQRITENGNADFGFVRGGGPTFDGQIHGLALALALFGGGVNRVDSMGDTPLAHVLLSWKPGSGSPTNGVVLSCMSGGTGPESGFYAAAFNARGGLFSDGFDSRVYPDGAARIVEQMKQMVRTRKPPVPYEQLIEPIAIAAAARLSHQQGKPVSVSDVMAAPAGR